MRRAQVAGRTPCVGRRIARTLWSSRRRPMTP